MTRTGGAAKPLALTMGEPAGIGGEIALKAWAGGKAPGFFLIDDPRRIERLADDLKIDVAVAVIESPAKAADVFAQALPVLPQALAGTSVPGTPDPANGPAVRAAIETAVGLAMDGAAAGVVTNPIHKQTLYGAGFPFPGHTEFLADLAGGGATPVMMLACPALRVVPVTVHRSLAEAIRSLDTASIVTAAMITRDALRRDFGIEKPRLAVAGLNPHAGEGGAMGTEERAIIEPAIRAIRDHGVEVRGPVPPDTLFTARARRTFDAAICMYHDQALIPIKTLDFDGAVNVTLGLPFVRTSPDHGTALDIAGTGAASESSLVAALNLAAQMDARRTAA